MNRTDRWITGTPAQRSLFDPKQSTPMSGDRAHARSADPETSKAAAASVANVRASHRRVLAMFQNYGDMTDERLSELLDAAAKETGFKSMSPSGVRSRRSELSKPNMDRLDQLKVYYEGHAVDQHDAEWIENEVRRELRIEGFRSPLWDTGKREKLSTGRQAIVWGVAR